METITGLQRNAVSIIAPDIVFTVAAALSVGLRFLSKYLTKVPIGADDLLILFGVICYIAVEGMVVKSVLVGRSATSVDDPNFVYYNKLVYAFSIFYFTIIACADASVLFLYRRIFVAKTFRRLSLVLIAVVAAWWIATTFPAIFVSNPIPSYWLSDSDSKFAYNYDTYWIIVMTIELVFETATLALPVYEISKLQLSLIRKAQLSAIFLLGAFVIATGIVRIILVYDPHGSDIDLTEGDIWLNIHCGSAIISACLPTLRPIVSRRARKRGRGSSYPSATEKTNGSGMRLKSTTKSNKSARNDTLDSLPRLPTVQKVSSGSESEELLSENELTLGGRVRTNELPV